MNDLRIDGQRLWQSLMDLARIGATDKGGVKRLALTDLDRQGRDLVVEWARAEGLHITVDQIGNVFMRREGTDPALPPVVTGSHIDTQPTGGKFDGNYGVLAGLEVVRTLNQRGIATRAPIEVAFWTNEEGSRFVPVMMGSGVFCGAFGLDTAYAARDVDGKSVGEELERIGYKGTQVPGDHPIGAYFETHIEQGPVLEDADKVIGVVPAVMGLSWYDCTVTGMEAHAGPTPMQLRRDALQVATGDHAGSGRHRPPLPAVRPRHGGHGAGVPEQPQRDSGPGEVQHRPAQRHRRFAGHDARRDHGLRRDRTRRDSGPAPSRTGTRVVLPAVSVPSRPASTAVRDATARLGYSDDGRGVRRRSRRHLRGAPGASRDDLRALQERHQPQRNRGCPAGPPGSRLPMCCCMRCSRMRRRRRCLRGAAAEPSAHGGLV